MSKKAIEKIMTSDEIFKIMDSWTSLQPSHDIYEELDNDKPFKVNDIIRQDYLWGWSEGDVSDKVYNLVIVLFEPMNLKQVNFILSGAYHHLMKEENSKPRDCYILEAVDRIRKGDYKFYYGT